METEDIKQLAHFLRTNGADVLNGDSKLTLSVERLNKLNSSFNLIIGDRETIAGFHVINNVKNDDYIDLKFLHDFVQRAAGLKLTHTKTDDFVDITKFKNVRLLELQKVNVDSVLGVGTLRPRLQYLICERSLSTLGEVLEWCGADSTNGAVWPELKEAVFRYNNLQEIDGSIECAAMLHTLDLSQNDITDAGALNCLSNLKHLNLSYNKLSSIPYFSENICAKLQILVLKNNFIENINEISSLLNLCELDLSNNCLIEHKSLEPLANLITLQYLNLDGNPLSYHPRHRTKTSYYLHNNASTVRFILDGRLLSKSEQKVIGSIRPSKVPRRAVIPASSSQGEMEKPRRIRQATISDTEQGQPLMECSIGSAGSLLASVDHLEAKRKIEELRKHYGEKWLHHEGGSMVQDVLGLEKTPFPHITSTPYGSVDAFIQAEINQPMHSLESNIEAPIMRKEESAETTAVYVTAPEIPHDSSLYESKTQSDDELSSEDELGDGEDGIYLATVKGESDPVFIVITATHLIEKEPSTKERARWPIETLILCEEHDKYIKLYFDTVRNDRRERCYELDEEETERLTKTLSEIVANRPPEEENLIVYNCLKCSSQFSRDKKKGEDKITCPSCKSPLVFEDDG